MRHGGISRRKLFPVRTGSGSDGFFFVVRTESDSDGFFFVVHDTESKIDRLASSQSIISSRPASKSSTRWRNIRSCHSGDGMSDGVLERALHNISIAASFSAVVISSIGKVVDIINSKARF